MPRALSVLAGLTVPALAVAALAVPGTRQLVADEVARTWTWTDGGVDTSDLSLPASGQTGRGWGTSVWPPQQGAGSRASSVLPDPPGRPAPPARPWERRGASTWQEQPMPAPQLAPELGPVQRFTATVAPGEAVTLPRGNGQPHLLCPGPTTPGVMYWLESTRAGGTRVHRYDGSGVYDFSYRYVTRRYQQTEPCA